MIYKVVIRASDGSIVSCEEVQQQLEGGKFTTYVVAETKGVACEKAKANYEKYQKALKQYRKDMRVHMTVPGQPKPNRPVIKQGLLVEQPRFAETASFDPGPPIGQVVYNPILDTLQRCMYHFQRSPRGFEKWLMNQIALEKAKP